MPNINCSLCCGNFSVEDGSNDVGAAQKLCKTCIMKKTETNAFAKCLHCRDSCQLSSKTCSRCQKNEAKYGKPSVCQYCQLPAAFLGKICQHCSNNEKRFGPPQQCHHCKLKAAFVKHAYQKDKKNLCRLCKSTYNRSLAVAEKLKVKRKLPAPSTADAGVSASSDHGLSTIPSKRLFFTPTGSPSAQKVNEAFGEHILTVTQLRDETQTLKRQIQLKDQTIFEKDKKIADLKAQLFAADKEHRCRINQIQKQHQDETNLLQEKLRTLTKQIATLSKANKTMTKKFDHREDSTAKNSCIF